ncbi:MAG TPA: deoxyribonuclease V [Nitrospirota bacterium]|nr:deoxyribonuclease V [Nitrospirota bacterium]
MKWPRAITIQEARTEQEQLKRKVLLSPFTQEPRFVAGADAAFSSDRVFAAACLYSLPDLTLIERRSAVRKLRFPYVPGFLAFREGPAIVAALQSLLHTPDLILVDGQGIAHPRRFGIASYVGVLLDIPAIGCAKSRLVGDYEEPGNKKGSWSPLGLGGKTVGAVVRTRDNVRPLFISPGHRTDVKSAIRLALSCLGNYRIPEPIRCADIYSKIIKKG